MKGVLTRGDAVSTGEDWLDFRDFDRGAAYGSWKRDESDGEKKPRCCFQLPGGEGRGVKEDLFFRRRWLRGEQRLVLKPGENKEQRGKEGERADCVLVVKIGLSRSGVG